MGADIHGVLQSRRTPPSGKAYWLDECEIDDTRQYLRFAYLANVRNYQGVDPISNPRGLPEGFGVDENDNHRLGGGDVWMGEHSHTWLTLDEIRDHDYSQDDREYLDTFFKWVEYAAARCGGYENGRIVIGFDS